MPVHASCWGWRVPGGNRRAAAAVPGHRGVILTAGATNFGLIEYEAALAAQGARCRMRRAWEDLAALFYTGGTTGRLEGC